MANYDFSTLNSSDLEELSCDLMNLQQPEGSNIRYKTFKDGQDKGIDFLYSTDTNRYEHVGQVKHYRVSGYKNMLRSLKDKEVDKVKRLKPERYLFFTSVDLLVSQTEELKTIFQPYIRNLNDIYGKSDINELIKAHPQILKTHFKLWLNSIGVMEMIFSSDMEFKSTYFVEEEIKKRVRLFVKTSLFEKAQERLKSNKFIVISGEPGVGKTTLAEMLSYEYIGQGFKFSFIEEPNEIDKVLIKDNSKQIIYYDDFLGSNYAEINKAQESESKLIRILKQISTLENKFLILTTRSLLLTKVSEESEKIRRFGLLLQSEILELTEYSNELKNKLLDNHIEESDLEEGYKDVLKDELLRNFIITHNTFTPRSVEFITSKRSIEYNRVKVSDYEVFIRSNFNYPQEIWSHAYNYQISEDDRLLLNTLFSFRTSPTYDELKRAFSNRLDIEVSRSNKTRKTNDLIKSFRRMEEGLIIKRNEVYNFINPSLKDFLIQFLKDDKDEMDKIVDSIVYINQFSDQIFESVNYNLNISDDLKNRLVEDCYSFVRDEPKFRDTDLIHLATILATKISTVELDDIIIEVIYEISDWQALHENYELNLQFRKLIDVVKSNNKIMIAIKEFTSEIVNDLVIGESDLNKSIDLLSQLKEAFQIDFAIGDYSELRNHFDELFSELIDNEVQWLFDWLHMEHEAYDKKDEIKKIGERLVELDFEYSIDLSSFDIDWWEVEKENEMQRLMAQDN